MLRSAGRVTGSADERRGATVERVGLGGHVAVHGAQGVVHVRVPGVRGEPVPLDDHRRDRLRERVVHPGRHRGADRGTTTGSAVADDPDDQVTQRRLRSYDLALAQANAALGRYGAAVTALEANIAARRRWQERGRNRWSRDRWRGRRKSVAGSMRWSWANL